MKCLIETLSEFYNGINPAMLTTFAGEADVTMAKADDAPGFTLLLPPSPSSSSSASSSSSSSQSSVKGVVIAVACGACSLGMTLLNKSVLNLYAFNHPVFIVAAQMLFTVCSLEALRAARYVTLPRYTAARAGAFLAPSVFYGVHSVVSLTALSGMNLPMYGVIKRCNPAVILMLGCLLLRRPPPGSATIVAVLMITAGCLVAGE